MLELLAHLVALQWRRSGAALREVELAGSRIWYAEFAPLHPPTPPPLRPAQAPGWRAGNGKVARSRRPPTLVLLHGLGATAASFHAVIGPLRQRYRVIVPDLPGCGWSRPLPGHGHLTFHELLEVSEVFLEHVAPGGTYLAGNSMGGWVAAKLAARRRDLIRGLGLLNPGGPGLNAEDWSDFGRLIVGEGMDTVPQLLERLFHRPPLATRFLARDIRRMLRHPSVLQLVTTFQPEDFVTAEELAQVDCPAVLIWGEKDRLIPDGCRSFFLEKLPRVRYEPVPDCGHCPQLERPRRTAEILLRLQRMRRRRGRREVSPPPGGDLGAA